MDIPTSSATRPLEVVDVPLGPAVVSRLLARVEAALGGGPAMLPVPEHPRRARADLIAAMQPGAPLETVDDDRVSFVVPTSGSTGEPKGVLLGAAAIAALVNATHERLGGPGRWLLALPCTHVGGLMVLARSVIAGTEPAALDLGRGFRPESLVLASRRFLGGTAGRRYTALVPRQLAVVLDTGGAALEALTAFDAVLVGGSSAPPELLDRARAAAVRVVATYGMTETCGGCVYDGVPLRDVSVQISTDGQIKIAGPVLASGYRLQPQLTAQAFADGWFASSDLGSLDSAGRLTVLGRADEVAISGGVNVPLAAVDALLTDHPGAAAGAAVAVPDPRWGQRVVAVLVPTDPSAPPTLESVRAHLARRAPAAYVPKGLVLAASLPMLPNGKVDRRALTASLLETTTA
jgi:o-succinylbenzoate---CoA ligase